ncbi:MAG: glutamate-5-semialdehyde dehydrogenase [Chloroflexota bacterium]|uniref:glutamate-5-semialdehyde dehydrogenase n=1 Tax=marine metagenome TaxID=408172 RepID=A0A381TZ90_9ZZZZ|nr:glutamate-5-semialdehyde dehydrogenase [Dehalococcoidia bacterium]MEC7912883.1 glutamate-5-semialdehyde dehydrogenase [Chloroflexota bacterium]HAT21327.1 glutamate-5-semialdehyde dehydrogenase [Dehalococcoidia bacterium]HBF01118.1 glutamate-5-semialdehyde dehydrogenase [Dehalococcoidia bacterium]HBR64926.1 glutamate-5-semialdehyde dehydrogenase [Dehalococcoidia bacterium]
MDSLENLGKAAKTVSRRLASSSGGRRNLAIQKIATALIDSEQEIISENSKDISKGRSKGLSEAMLDRLIITKESIHGMSSDALRVVSLDDPVGEMIEMKTMENGLQVGRKRVPLGVIGVIYESRPNVTVDISVLCLKSGNAVILRGGSEAFYSNQILAKVIRDAVLEAGLPKDSIQIVQSTDRKLVSEMLNLDQYIDLMIPRGGQDLVNMVASESKMPSITGGVGVCHTYVDSEASLDMAVEVVNNAKVQRPSVCNALDTVLVHSSLAPDYLPRMAETFAVAGVELRCDIRALSILGPREDIRVVPAKDEDWDTEHLSLIAGVKIVDSLEEAINHIENHGTGHSDAIITENYSTADRFVREVDSSAVMVNASTRFNDGGQFGLGAEVAISTNKMHARGPMGLKEITSYKWVVLGNGHIRQ